MLTVHYTWVGPPDRQRGRDTVAPVALAKAHYGPQCVPFVIDFWCLNAHVQHYRTTFRTANFRVRGREKIRVRGIESYLEGVIGERRRGFYHRSTPLMQAFNWVRYQSGWNLNLVVRHIITHSTRRGAQVREIVNAKNVWSLYAMAHLGGYVMDTGVGPRGAVNLREYAAFKAPKEQGTFYTHTTYKGLACSVTPPIANQINVAAGYDTGPRLDVWTMYAPRGDAYVLHGLNWYVRYWYELETYRSSNGVNDTYKDLCRNAIISSVMTAICKGGGRNIQGKVPGNVEAANTWDAVLDGGHNNPAGIAEIRINKTYYGSHH